MTALSRLPLSASCTCGACTLEVWKTPKLRFICHCTVCQEFTGAAFSDVIVVRARDLTLQNIDAIEFKTLRPPPNLNRGRCKGCRQPIMETSGAGALKLMIVPAQAFMAPEMLPPVRMHVFYHRRLKDVDDSLPKHSGYWPSQFAILGSIATKM